MKKILAIALVLAMCLCMFAGCQNNQEPTEPEIDLTGEYNITMWVSELAGVSDLFQQQIDAFEAANPGIVINASIEGVSEANAAGQITQDVSTAPDIYCFAQDQLATLVTAAALAAPGKGAAANIIAANDAGSVAAGTVAGTLWAYPMTSDNGYYLYYDKSIISDEDAESLEKIIAACEKNGKKFRFALENAWYTASFFFATDCHSNWTTDSEGGFNAVDDDFNSDKGVIAMKGMQKLAQSSCYDSNADIFTDAGAIVTGIWAAEAAAAHFGDNLGATDLPSFTVDGKSYHLGSYTGNKLMGVKPQQDAKKAALLSKLAQYLTNEQCQLQRFDKFQWGPSNKAAQASEAVQSNLSLAALAKQGEYGQPQGQIHSGWWSIAGTLGASAKANKDITTTLSEYAAAINGLVTMTEEQKMAWGVIGSLAGTNWDTDLPMTKVNDTTWESAALDLNAGDQFKLRRGAGWVPQVGKAADGTYFVRLQESEADPGNIVVETAGKFIIRLEWDGTSNTCNVTFVPAT